jgi:branched-chain amino acid transport system ATP-binding protein
LGVLLDKITDCRREGLTQLPALREAVERYCKLEFRHMGREEAEILSLAHTHLTEGDWEEIDTAFAANDDPLFGSQRGQAFSRLYSWIVTRAPAPHGLGTRAGDPT